MQFHFHVGALRSGNLLCIYQTSPLPLFAKAEPSLAFDQNQMVSRTLDRKILAYLADNASHWSTLSLVLLNKGLSPHRCPSSPKCFNESQRFQWEPWANPSLERGGSWGMLPGLVRVHMPSLQLGQLQHKRPSRLNVCFQSLSQSALQHYQITTLRQASQCMLLAEKTHVIGSQILWERQGTLILSCPKNNMGILHPHVGIPGTDMQPLIIPWPVSHLTEFMYSKKLWFHLLGHTIPGKKQVPV